MSKWRRSSIVTLTIALALIALGADALHGQGRQPARSRRTVMLDGREVVEGAVIIRYRAEAGSTGRERAEFQADGDVSESIGRLGARRLRSRGMTTRQMLATLRANPDVDFVEPDFIIRASATPNDSSFGVLWGLLNTGQSINGQAGTPGADIGATTAWDVTTGSRLNVVAIIDSGIDFAHPDLAANLYSAPRDFSVTLGSTTVTCAAGSHGFNALTNSCVPADDNGHGTHVAGIIGAAGNNGIGVTGVNWTASLMALKVLGADGTGTTSDAIKAIDFAIKAKAALGADANVRVLNASWGGASFSQALSDEIDAANTADMLFVAAAGSNGTNDDASPHYPAAGTNSNIISVAAIDNTGELAAFSNYGATSVDLAAPGYSILSTFTNNSYAYLSGTSMAAPYVAGAAALVLSTCPMTTADLKSTLLSSVVPAASLSGKTVSGGRLNVDAALRLCEPGTGTITINTPTVAPGASIEAAIATDHPRSRDWVGLYSPGAADGAFLDWTYLNGTKTAPSTGLANATIALPAPSTPGTYQLRLFTNGYVKLATSSDVTVANAPSLSINDVTVTEGNSGTTLATFTVTLSRSVSQTVTVNYATADGSATAGTDFTAASGTLTFAPSTLTRQFSVTVVGDTTSEPTETFLVNLSNATNAAIADGQGVGTITTDDGSPTPSMTAPASVAPGALISTVVSNGPGKTGDWIGLYHPADANGSFMDWWYLNGSKTAPASGLSNATLQLPAPTATGAYQLRWFTTGYTLLASANVTVATMPLLSINDVAVMEGNSGTTTATFTVTLSAASSSTVTVNYATADGSATSPSDYAAASGMLTFSPSVTTRTITVTVNGDGTVEPSETFLVNLTAPSNASLSDAQGVGTITTDDGAPSPSMTASPSPVAPGATISVAVDNGPARPNDWIGLYHPSDADGSFMDWWYLNGSKTAPTSGVSSATVQLPAPASNGTYQLRWFTTGYARLATATVTVASMPVLAINDVAVVEGNTGTTTAVFTVTLSPASSSTVTVNYATADGSATNPSDYAAASGALTFSPSVTTRTISVTVNGDSLIEPSETFVVNLSAPSNASLGDAQGVGTITTDDGSTTPSMTVTPSPAAPGAMLSAAVSNGPGRTTDWIGIYHPSDPDSSFIDWWYLNGSKTAPATGLSSATVQIPAPAATGTYQLRWFTTGYTTLATSTITVSTQSSSSATSLTVNTPNVNRGGTIEVVVSNGPGNPNDWIGVYASPSAADSSFVDWVYLNGQKTLPASGQSTITVHFAAPSVAGTYELRLFMNGYTKLATSSSIVVSP